MKLEEEVLRLQGQLQAQDADMAELHLKCQAAERRAAKRVSEPAPANKAGNDSRTMQTSTRNMLLAQVTTLLLRCCSSLQTKLCLLSQHDGASTAQSKARLYCTALALLLCK